MNNFIGSDYKTPFVLLSKGFNTKVNGDCDFDCDQAEGDIYNFQPISKFTNFNKLSSKIFYIKSPESQIVRINEFFFIRYGVQHTPVVLNQFAEDLLSIFLIPITIPDSLKELHQYSMATNKKKSFLNSLLQSRLIAPTDNSRIVKNHNILTSWLHITDRCNLRCDYCYLPHLREDMTIDIGKASIDALFRSAKNNNYSHVKVKYAGGESLIKFDVIKELHSYAVRSSQYNEISLSGIILSNGTLLNSTMAKEIKLLNLSLMISLDGLGNVHDAQRRFTGGQGSFEAVKRGIMIALGEGVSPHISITVSGKNAYGLPELIQWILENNLTFSINFYRENELAFNLEDLKLDEEKIISGILAAYKVIENNLPRRSLLNGIVDRANLSSAHSHTCGVGNNYMVFDYKGMISKCQMQMKKPVTNVKVDDPLKLIQLDQLGIQNLHVNEKEGCKNCEWKYWCTGGCSLLTHSVTGRYDVKSPNCRIYKAIYPEAMRLEGLRLLKYADSFSV